MFCAQPGLLEGTVLAGSRIGLPSLVSGMNGDFGHVDSGISNQSILPTKTVSDASGHGATSMSLGVSNVVQKSVRDRLAKRVDDSSSHSVDATAAHLMGLAPEEEQ
jgi:hypothetical protein